MKSPLLRLLAWPVTILTLASIALSAPFLFFGASPLSDDALDHARWYENFSTQLWAGEFYPRWLTNMNLGLGSPVFYYYPPLPYYATSLLRPFFPNDGGGWHQLGISAAIALLLSGTFAFLWLRSFASDRAALIGAILYVAGPYHLASDLYVRFAFAELWSFVWMPLILYFVHRIAGGDKRAILGIAIGYALLSMTHLPTTLIFSACVLLYVGVIAREHRFAALGWVALAMLLGAGLAAIYLYPALTMEQYVFLDAMSTGYFSYSNWLLPSSFGLWTQDKIVIALLALDLIVVALLAFMLSRDDGQVRRIRIFWLVGAVVSFLMMTDVSRPIWWLLPPLDRIQFPFRFGTILTLAVTALLTLSIAALEKKSRTSTMLRYATIILVVAWLGGAAWAASTVWQGFGQGTNAMLDTPDTPEYRPRWNQFMRSIDWETSKDEDYWDERMNADFMADLKASGVTNGDPSRVIFQNGAGAAEIRSWQPRNIVLDVTGDGDATIEVGQFYFPNWHAMIDGRPSENEITPAEPHGLISLAVPGGRHEVQLTLDPSREELVGEIISFVSLLVLAVAAAFLVKR